MKMAFVGGTGRCGTTVLWKMLSRHPQVASLPVRHRFIIDPDGIVDFYNTVKVGWSPFACDRALERLEDLLMDVVRNRAYRYSGLALEKYIPDAARWAKRMIEDLTTFDYDAVWVGGNPNRKRMRFLQNGWDTLGGYLGWWVGRLFQSVATHEQTCFVDGDTWNILYADTLNEIFFNSKLIHIYRDPRDVVASMMGQGWCPKDMGRAISHYKCLMDRWWEIRELLPKRYYHEVSLEDLVDPERREEETRRILKHLNLPWADELMAFDLSKPNTGRWRDAGFSEHDLYRLEKHVHGLGYR